MGRKCANPDPPDWIDLHVGAGSQCAPGPAEEDPRSCERGSILRGRAGLLSQHGRGRRNQTDAKCYKQKGRTFQGVTSGEKFSTSQSKARLAKRFARAGWIEESSLTHRPSEARQENRCRQNYSQACGIARGAALRTSLRIAARVSPNPTQRPIEIGEFARGSQSISRANEENKITPAIAVFLIPDNHKRIHEVSFADREIPHLFKMFADSGVQEQRTEVFHIGTHGFSSLGLHLKSAFSGEHLEAGFFGIVTGVAADTEAADAIANASDVVRGCYTPRREFLTGSVCGMKDVGESATSFNEPEFTGCWRDFDFDIYYAPHEKSEEPGTCKKDRNTPSLQLSSLFHF
jgi:hypothetical protein